MARVTRLELATPGVTGRYSNQLSYTRIFEKFFEQAHELRLADGQVKHLDAFIAKIILRHKASKKRIGNLPPKTKPAIGLHAGRIYRKSAVELACLRIRSLVKHPYAQTYNSPDKDRHRAASCSAVAIQLFRVLRSHMT